ncbi:MAG: LacI family DNA-binding transcriptional regulator, partial [Rikenellaceae bacterium]
MIKRISISDVAKALSVSVSTISRALHDHPSISEEMKRQVRLKAKELNYRPNSYAVNLKKGSCKTIAVIVPLINRNFFSSAINGIEEIAQQNGYDVMIYQSRNVYEHERHIVNSLSFGKVDGVIASVADSSKDYLHYSQMVDYGMPLVFFDRILPDLHVGSVRIDDAKGSYMATEHFLKQGIRKIYHFSGPRNVIIWDDRAKGYAAAMSDYGVQVEPSWIYENPTTEANGAKYMQSLISGG